MVFGIIDVYVDAISDTVKIAPDLVKLMFYFVTFVCLTLPSSSAFL